MTTAQSRRPALPQQVSAGLRFAAAVAVAAVLALVWIGAEHESHKAVQSVSAAITRDAGTTTQPAMAIATRRDAASAKRI